jgi:hypothetical protein
MAFLLAASTDDDLRTLFGKLDCGDTANTGIAASDQGNFFCKMTHSVLLSGTSQIIVDKRLLVIFATARFVPSFAYERQRLARTKILAVGPTPASRVRYAFRITRRKPEQRMCQTMPMFEKSKNVRNRRVLDVAAWPRTDCDQECVTT